MPSVPEERQFVVGTRTLRIATSRDLFDLASVYCEGEKEVNCEAQDATAAYSIAVHATIPTANYFIIHTHR